MGACTIACLGWGSLIWCPGNLQIGKWKCDGPSVKVEFVRKSQGERLTLVLFNKAARAVPSLWACMDEASLDKAVKALAKREGCIEKCIGRWPGEDWNPATIIDLESWAKKHGVDHVIWTKLGPKFCGLPVEPTEDQAVAYLRKLSVKCIAANAKEYVRKAPPQIRTAYRRRIEHCLGWTPLNS